jgi:hypothetical protein
MCTNGGPETGDNEEPQRSRQTCPVWKLVYHRPIITPEMDHVNIKAAGPSSAEEPDCPANGNSVLGHGSSAFLIGWPSTSSVVSFQSFSKREHDVHMLDVAQLLDIHL